MHRPNLPDSLRVPSGLRNGCTITRIEVCWSIIAIQNATHRKRR